MEWQRPFVKASRLAVFFLALGLSAARAEPRGPIVLINSTSSADWAKASCRLIILAMKGMQCGPTSCPDLNPLIACKTSINPGQEAEHFIDELMAQFAIHRECSGVSFVRLPNIRLSADEAISVMEGPHWDLSLYYVLGEPLESWDLQYQSIKGHETGPYMAGKSPSPERMASDVCTIVMGRGGIVR